MNQSAITRLKRKIAEVADATSDPKTLMELSDKLANLIALTRRKPVGKSKPEKLAAPAEVAPPAVNSDLLGK